MKTYRYRGHSMSDPAKYRTPRGDPEDAQRARLHRARPRPGWPPRGVAEAEVQAIDDEVKRVVQDAADFAQQSPEPEARELWTDVLVEG